jgi:hypothetical protein
MPKNCLLPSRPIERSIRDPSRCCCYGSRSRPHTMSRQGRTEAQRASERASEQGRLRSRRAVAARLVGGTMSSPLPTFQSKLTV